MTSKDIHGDDVTSALCTLDHTCRQTSVALTFGWDEDVVFSLAEGGGEGPVSLTGYLQPSPEVMENDGFPDGDSDDDSNDDDGEGRGGVEDSDEEDSDEDSDEDDDGEEDDDEEAPQLVAASEKRKRSFDVSCVTDRKTWRHTPAVFCHFSCCVTFIVFIYRYRATNQQHTYFTLKQLDSDALESRSHGQETVVKKGDAAKKSKKEAAMEEEEDSEDDEDDDDEDEELDEEVSRNISRATRVRSGTCTHTRHTIPSGAL